MLDNMHELMSDGYKIQFSNFWYVLLSVLLWSFIYLMTFKVIRSKSLEWNCRVIAVLHSLVATRVVEMSFMFDKNLFKTIGERNTLMQTTALILSSGYFIFDFIWCIVMRTEGIMMLLHHVISILSLIGGLYLDHSGSEICITLWGSELSNPFLQARWFLREAKQYTTEFAVANDFIFFGVFAYARIGIGTGLAYLFYFAEKSITIIKFGGFLFHVISIIWMWQIWKFLKRKYFSVKTEANPSLH